MRNNFRIVTTALIFLLAADLMLVLSAPRHRARWDFLGERVVTDRLDHDTIRVTAAEGRFTKLQVRVKQRAVQFRSMTVHFANGDVQNVQLRDVIPAGGKSRVIDLPGAARVIKKVEFSYDAQAILGGKAKVRLFGRH